LPATAIAKNVVMNAAKRPAGRKSSVTRNSSSPLFHQM